MKYLLIMLLIYGCSDCKYVRIVDVKKPIYCVNECINHKLNITDEPFSGDAMKELRLLCEDLYKVEKCEQFLRTKEICK